MRTRKSQGNDHPMTSWIEVGGSPSGGDFNRTDPQKPPPDRLCEGMLRGGSPGGLKYLGKFSLIRQRPFQGSPVLIGGAFSFSEAVMTRNGISSMQSGPAG